MELEVAAIPLQKMQHLPTRSDEYGRVVIGVILPISSGSPAIYLWDDDWKTIETAPNAQLLAGIELQ